MDEARSTNGLRAFIAIAAGLLCFVSPSALHATPTPRFPRDAIWYRDISTQAPDLASAEMIGASILNSGAPITLKIDFSFRLLDGTSAPRLPLGEPGDDYHASCDRGLQVPVPKTGAVEGEPDYRCSGDGDCHLLVVDGHTLYEGLKVNVDAKRVHALCMVRWRLDRAYPADGRGDQCTSADAAGFPIAPLTFNADEVAEAARGNGDLGHALRFVLPNRGMRAGVYVRPATHAGAPSGPSNAIPYGARLRLKDDVAIERFDAAAQVVLRTLRNYGAFVADGGRVPLTAQSDLDTKTKWAELDLGENTLRGLTLADFDVMPIGRTRALTADCRRNATP